MHEAAQKVETKWPKAVVSLQFSRTTTKQKKIKSRDPKQLKSNVLKLY